MSKRPIYLEKDKSYDISDVLYRGHCSDCGEQVGFEADFDADGTTYTGTCYDCGKRYFVVTSKLKVADISEGEDD